MKGGGSVMTSEAEMLRLIASRTTIRVPRVHRSFQLTDDTQYFGTSGYIVMDFLPGQPLDECWNALSGETQGKIAAQVAAMIQEMQAIEHLKPAPLVEDHVGVGSSQIIVLGLFCTQLKWKLGLITS
jgi:hypothetical protein